MFGLLRRLLTLVVLAVAVVGVWYTRDLWLPKLRTAMGGGAEPPVAARTDSVKVRSASDTGWMSLTSPAAERGRQSLSRLTKARGPAFVSMSAGEFAGAVLDSLASQLPPSADSVQVRAIGNEFQVHATVRLGDVGGRAVLGPLAAMVGDRERLLLGGTLEPTAVQGRAQFRLTRVKIGDFAVPSAVVPRLVRSLKPRGGTPGVESGAFPIRLPAGVGDVRVTQGRVTLYRAAP